MVAFAAMQWGIWPLVLHWADGFGPLPAAVQSTIVMIAITCASGPLMFVDRVRKKAEPWHWLGVAWLGLADAMNIILLFRAYQLTTVGIAVTTHYLAPILVAGASPFILRERSKPRTWAAVIIAFVGLVVMLRPWADGIRAQDFAGAAFGLGSAAFYASNVLVNKRLVHVFSGTELMFFHGLVATPILAALAPPSAWSAVTLNGALVLFAGGVGPGAFGGLLFIWALRRIPASHAMTLTLLEPLTAFIVGIAALRQVVPAVSAVGGVIILATTASVMTDRNKG
jgi:drug/metabolite transporter (DMT)-like permease